MIFVILYCVMIAAALFDGSRRVVYYFKQKDVDNRPFSFSRLFVAKEAQTPTEELVNGILELSIASLAIYYHAYDFINVFFGCYN